jgi:hypothetical protein
MSRKTHFGWMRQIKARKLLDYSEGFETFAPWSDLPQDAKPRRIFYIKLL